MNLTTDQAADEEGHVWVDASSKVLPVKLAPGLALPAERTEAGFILWRDRQVKFSRHHNHPSYLPAVEFRELAEGEK